MSSRLHSKVLRACISSSTNCALLVVSTYSHKKNKYHKNKLSIPRSQKDRAYPISKSLSTGVPKEIAPYKEWGLTQVLSGLRSHPCTRRMA